MSSHINQASWSDPRHFVFPRTQVPLCLVHMVRHRLPSVSWKQRKGVAADLSAPTIEQAESNLTAFAAKWDAGHPTISRSLRNNWERPIPFFGYPPDIRKAIYTTNAVESLNLSLRKVTKNRGSFPNDEAMVQLLVLASEIYQRSGPCRSMTGNRH